MNIARRIIPVVVLAVGLLVVFQLLRMNVLVSPKSLIHREPTFQSNTKVWLSDDQMAQLNTTRILVLGSQEQETEIKNIEQVLKQMGLDYEVLNNDQSPDTFDRYRGVIFLQRTVFDYPDWPQLMQAVQQGLDLLYLGNGTTGPSDFLRLEPESFGIIDYSDVRPTSQLFFNVELLSGLKGLYNLSDYHFESEPMLDSLDVLIQPDTSVFLETEAGNPLVWSIRRAEGTVMVMNTGHYETKLLRGILAGALSQLLETVAYPVINAQVVFIDDFPADYQSEQPILRQHYNRTMQRFMLDLWWPEISQLMKKYGIKATGAFINSYNDDVTSPFDANDSIRTMTERLATELISSGGEIAMHGYNHQPLFLDEEIARRYTYKAWPDDSAMTEALQVSARFFNLIYPKYDLTTYVPPSNLMDQTSIESLKAALPLLKTISGIYYDEIDATGKINQDTFTQDYGLDSRYGVAFPRATSQGILSESMKFELASVVTTHGVISHFLHPDDILDPDRSNGLLWEDLALKADELFGYFDEKYGWLEKTTATGAADKVIQIDNVKIYTDQSDHFLELTADGWSDGLSVILFSPKEILAAQGCEFQRIDSLRYLITMHQSVVTLEVG